jgi:long-chain acyl-CoA synthetase
MLENKLKESILIDQVIVIGNNEKFASALISPNFEYLHDWCYENKIHFIDNKELILLPEVQNLYQQEIKELNKTLGQHEEIKRFRLVPDSWSPQTGELSQTLKLKRKHIEVKYKHIIDNIFAPSRDGVE